MTIIKGDILEIEFIIGAVLFIIVAVLIFKIIKKIILAILLVFLIFILSMAGVGFLVYEDMMDMKEKFFKSSNLLLLEDNGKIISALQMQGFDEEGFDFLDEKWISSKQEAFQNHDYDEIIGRNYKIFIIKLETFSNIENIQFEDLQLTKEDVFNISRASNSLDVFFQISSRGQNLSEMEKALLKQNLEEEFGSQNLKGIMFGMLFAQAVEKEGVLFIIENFKQNNIVIYPETITFKLVKSVPNFVYEIVSNKLA